MQKWEKSLEEAGRIVRSNAFETVCRESGANKIATAHHKNDNAETVLLNLARGSGLQGMCGIRPVYGNRIRPLLCLTRKEIEEWLEEEQISYCTDETNEEDEYTRNRIRHKILPVMEQEINRQTVEHINRLSLQAEEIWEYLKPADGCGMETDGPSGGCFGGKSGRKAAGEKGRKAGRTQD